MELPESGNVKDLVRYRIETEKSDLQTTKELITKIEEYCVRRMKE